MFNVANHPHHTIGTQQIASAGFMQATAIANTGRDGLDERTVRIGLHLGW